MNCGSRGNFQLDKPIHDFLAMRNEVAHFTALRPSQNRLQVGARDENRFLCGSNDQTA